MHRSLVGAHLALALALAVMSTLSAAALAQYDHEGTGARARPAHIHVGACPTPGEIVGPLSPVGPSLGVTVAAPEALRVELSRSTFDLSLSELVAAGHVVAVHLAHDQMETIIACGDIGGPMRSATELVIGLAPVADSGYSGIAVLADAGQGMTVADVYITMSSVVASPSP